MPKGLMEAFRHYGEEAFRLAIETEVVDVVPSFDDRQLADRAVLRAGRRK
ncbi:hypothetical protein [Bradyrhizobium sp. USDA 10063]